MSGQPVLLLHGQPGTSADLAGVAAALRRKGFQVVVPDRPGYGANKGHAGGFDHNATEMVALLDRLGLTRVIVAGHSWGAGVALALAEHHPERVAAVVMICPVVPDEQLGLIDRVLAGRRAGPVIARAAFAAAGTTLSVPRLRGLIAGRLPGVDRGRLDEVAREWRSGRAWRSFWVEQRALFRDLPALGSDLARVAAPVTVVVGADDNVADPEASRRFAAAVGARLVQVPRAGHLLPMQRPAEVAAAIAATATPGSAT